MTEKQYFYDSATKKSPIIQEFLETIKYRELIYQLTRRDFLTRYKRSIFGIAWTMLNPLGMMLVLSFAFSKIFRFETSGNYSIYVLSGLLVWNFFSQTTTACMNSLVWGGGLFQRIYLPRSTFAISSMVTGIINWLFACVPLFGIMFILENHIPWTIITIPLAMFLALLFSLGIGLSLSAIGIYFPDVVEMYQIILTMWMYVTPVIYPETILPLSYRWIIKINPMYYIINLFRLSVYEERLPTMEEFIPALAFSLGVFIIGWALFAYKSKEFAYRT